MKTVGSDKIKKEYVKSLFVRYLHKFKVPDSDQSENQETIMPSLLLEEDNEEYQEFFKEYEKHIESKTLPEIVSAYKNAKEGTYMFKFNDLNTRWAETGIKPQPLKLD